MVIWLHLSLLIYTFILIPNYRLIIIITIYSNKIFIKHLSRNFCLLYWKNILLLFRSLTNLRCKRRYFSERRLRNSWMALICLCKEETYSRIASFCVYTPAFLNKMNVINWRLSHIARGISDNLTKWQLNINFKFYFDHWVKVFVLKYLFRHYVIKRV